MSNLSSLTSNKQLSHKIYDTIVIGLGGAGSSSLYHLAQTGRKVLGIEQFNLHHKNGSSHGDSRIIRQAYFEGEYYVPFVKDAYVLWDKIERESGKELFINTKTINIGDKRSKFVEKCKNVCDLHNLSHTVLDHNEINTTYPFFNVNSDFEGLLEEKGGALIPEECISAYLEEAIKSKADILLDSKLEKISFNKNEDLYDLSYSSSRENSHDKTISNVKARSLVLSSGSWISNIIKENFNISIPFTVDLNYVYYFKLKDEKKYSPFPIYLISTDGCEFYGFPDLKNGNGYKMSIYHQNMPYGSQSLVRREFSNEKFQGIKKIANKFLTEMQNDNMELTKHLTCLYTSTPDKDFLIDYLPGNCERVVVVSACSGHGFKFMSRVGDHAVKLLDKKEKPIQQFKIDRLFKH